MKTSILTIGSIACCSVALLAQEIEYINPPALQSDQYKIELSDIVSQKDYCKLKISLENISKNQYLRYNFSKTGFKYEAGTYYSDRSSDIVIAPSDKKSRVSEVKGNAGFLVHSFDLQLEGLSIAQIPNEPLAVADFALEVGKTNNHSQNGFEISSVKVEQSKKKDKVSAQLKISFNGQANELGLVNLQNAVILDKNGNKVGEFSLAPDKVQELLAGEDFKLNVNITSTETAFTLSWVGAFKLLNFQPSPINPLTIRSTKGGGNSSANSGGNSSADKPAKAETPEWDMLIDMGSAVKVEINTKTITKKGNIYKVTVREINGTPSMIFNGKYRKWDMTYYELNCETQQTRLVKSILYDENDNVIHEQAPGDWGKPSSTAASKALKYVCDKQ